MKRIFIIALCIVEVVLVAVGIYYISRNIDMTSEIVEETPVEEVVLVDCYNKDVDEVSLELFGVTESNRSEIFSQVKYVVGKARDVEEIRDGLNELGIHVGGIEISRFLPTFRVKAYDKQGYDHHIEVSILDSKASKEEATAKIQSYYAGLSKAEASDVNKAYLNELIGKGFEVSRFIMFAKPEHNNCRVTARSVVRPRTSMLH